MARHKTMHTGLLDPVTRSLAPAQIEGVRQRGGPVIPSVCPKCDAPPPGWTIGAWIGHCRPCGTTFFRTLYTMAAPIIRRHGNPHPVPPRRPPA